MPITTKIKNRKMWILDFLAFLFYGLMTVGVGFYVIVNYARYGWYHEEIRLTLVSFNAAVDIGVVVIFFVTALLLILNANQQIAVFEYSKDKKLEADYGIEFPQGRPDYWDISVDMEKQCLEIGLNDSKISISKETIDGLFRGEVKKNE